MEKIINNSILPLIADGRISMSKISILIDIKEFVDRISDKTYLVNDTIETMTAKFGTSPDIVTWGDFFQADLAMSAVQYGDEEFIRIVETVRFDLMSAWDIFLTNSEDFCEWIDESSCTLAASGKTEWEFNEDEKEISHLKVLKDYYCDMGLNGNFYESELLWYNSFFDAKDQSVTA